MKLQLALLTTPLLFNTTGNYYNIDYTVNKITLNRMDLIFNRSEEIDNNLIDVERYDNTSNTPYGNIEYLCLTTRKNNVVVTLIMFTAESFSGTSLNNFNFTITFDNDQQYKSYDVDIYKYQVNLQDNWKNDSFFNPLTQQVNENGTYYLTDYTDNYRILGLDREINSSESYFNSKIDNVTVQSSMKVGFCFEIRNLEGEKNNISNNNPLSLNFNVAPNVTMEVIDVGGLLFEILSMPFTFMSGFFNITLFPGTPYQFNISNIILGLLATLALIAIIKIGISIAGKIG